MNAKQRRNAGKPLTKLGCKSKFMSSYIRGPVKKGIALDVAFKQWLDTLNDREINGFALHGIQAIEESQSDWKQPVSRYAVLACTNALKEYMRDRAERDLLRNNNEDDS